MSAERLSQRYAAPVSSPPSLKHAMNIPVTWAIQTNFIADEQIRRVWRGAEAARARVQEVQVVPFSDELGNEVPELDGVVIPYGATKLTRLAQRRGWRGLCFDEAAFRVDAWNRERDDMLNQHVRQMTVRECMAAMRAEPEDSVWFVRPVQDLKHFDGTVTVAKEIGRWMSSVDSGNYSFDETTEVILAPVKKIHGEWRFFVVDGQVVDGSSYRIAGQRMANPVARPELYEIAQELADGWLPHRTCAMDVALTDDGYKVIEFNTFNSSGFYAHDIEKVVAAVTRHFAEAG